MKIVLVRPPFMNIKKGPPIGLAYLSNVLKNAGHEVNIFDINIFINKKYRNIGNYTRNFVLPESHKAVIFAYRKIDDYCTKILALAPDLVGFSLSYPTFQYGIELAKRLSKHVRCIAGGPQATFNEESLLGLGCFDTVVSGYGEEAVLDALTKNGIISKELDRSKDYQPDYIDLPLNHYKGVLPVITSRGCPNRCHFCTQHLPLFFHSLDSIIDRIKKNPKIREIIYNDSNINISPKRTEYFFTELAKLKKPPPGHVFGLEVKKGFERYISKMSEAGIKIVRVGIESGAIRERNSMNKKFFDNDLVIAFIKELSDHKITTWAQYIFCYPDQTEEDRQETLALMAGINRSCKSAFIKHFWYRFVVHHGTEKLFQKKYGVIYSSPLNWKNGLYTTEKIEKLAEKYRLLIPINARIFL